MPGVVAAPAALAGVVVVAAVVVDGGDRGRRRSRYRRRGAALGCAWASYVPSVWRSASAVARGVELLARAQRLGRQPDRLRWTVRRPPPSRLRRAGRRRQRPGSTGPFAALRHRSPRWVKPREKMGRSRRARAPPPSRLASVTSPPQRRASSRAIGSPSPVPRRPGAAGAAAVEALEHRSSSPGARPGPAVEHVDAAGRGPRPSTSLPSAVVHRVLDQRVERAVEVGRRAERRRPAPSATHAAAPPRARPSAPRRGRAASLEVDALARRVDARRPATARAARRRSPTGGRPRAARRRSRSRVGARARPRAPPRAAAAARSAACAAGATRRRRTRAGASSSALEPRGHLVERARERALLGAALDLRARVDRSPSATRRAARRAAAAAARPTRRSARRRPARAQHDHADQRPGRASPRRTARVDRVDALGHAHRAVGASVAHDRHGRGEDVLRRASRCARCSCASRPRSAAAISGRCA